MLIMLLTESLAGVCDISIVCAAQRSGRCGGPAVVVHPQLVVRQYRGRLLRRRLLNPPFPDRHRHVHLGPQRMELLLLRPLELCVGQSYR